MSAHPPLDLAIYPRSTTTLVTSSIPSVVTAQPNEQKRQEMFPPTDPSNHDRSRNTSAFNFYFLFLAAFGMAIAALLWWIHRRRSRGREVVRLNGQHALARDMNNWTRQGRSIGDTNGPGPPAPFGRFYEGLDMRGNAPPPYHPLRKISTMHELPETPQDPVSGLTIPLKTLSRTEIERVERAPPPPDYDACTTAGAKPYFRREGLHE